MIYNQILVRFGDLTLKGKNQKVFLKTLFRLMDEKMEGLNEKSIKICNTELSRLKKYKPARA